MKSFGFLATALAAVIPYIGHSAAHTGDLHRFSKKQSGTPVTYTDPGTGIIFNTWPVSSAQTAGGLTFGVALPSNALTVDANEFIGILTCSSQSASATGWCGMSLGGPMTNSLLLAAWPNNGEVLTSFRWTTAYAAPVPYEGPAKLTQISSTVNATHYQVIFRCQECLSWEQGGVAGKASTSAGYLVLGWAQAFPSPSNPTCPAQAVVVQHDNGFGIFGAQLDSNAANPSYTAWAAQATKTVTGTCGATTTTTISSIPVPTATSYDYIVVGAGAGGIPLADKLSSTGKSVLLIEKGPPSSGRYGGTMKPNWLQGTNLTRFDVPGLCNQIWVDSAGIACTDTDQMAGCVLGGGTAVNAGLWWRPYALDWDYNFPKGWKSGDMVAATSRVFGRIPGTDVPSSDGKLYLQEGFEAVASGLKAGGWSQVQANNVPNSKNRTYAHTPYMFQGGERGGPMATYLVSSLGRKNFKMWVNTTVKRVVRTGGHATGLEVEAFGNGGYAGTVSLTPVTGRVILSAGTFGSAKLLLRSGIGPKDQLDVVKGSRQDGSTMIDSSQWINLPVGYNLEDHTNTDTVVSHPSVVFYDFYEAWTSPNPADKDAYLNKRAGILTQAAPNIGPVFWEEIKGADGIVRQLQWTARVEGSMGAPNGKAITMSQYLGRGATSRGRMTITSDLTTLVSTDPFLRDPNDKAAVIQGIKNLQAALKNVKGLEWNFPNASISVEDYVNSIPATYGFRRANHWIGTAKMGTDDGRNGGSAVVDVDTKVWGTDNIHVVDASIFPGMVTTNPSAYIVVASERASERILALPAIKAAGRYQQCGGQNFNGPFICGAPYTCQVQNAYYAQCL